MLNRTKLLAILAKNGYAGPAKLETVKEWVETHSVSIADSTGKPIDLDSVWSKTVHIMADAGEDVQIHDAPEGSEPVEGEEDVKMEDEDEDEDEMSEESESKSHRRRKGSSRVRRVDSKMRAPAVHSSDSASVGRKHYESKSRATSEMTAPRLTDAATAKFRDAHSAEVFAASARLAIAKAVPQVADYDEKSNDQAIVREISRGSGIRQMCGKAGSIGNPTTGGVLAPRGYLQDMIYLSEAYGVARRLANVQIMTDGVVDRPRKTAIQGMNHQAENGSFANQDPSYDMVTLTAKKIGALTLISTELMEDSAINVADDIAASFAEAQLIREDQDVFIGNGTSTYGGHVGLSNATWLQTETTDTWASVAETDLDALLALPANFSPSAATFVMSRQAFYATFYRLAKGKGGVTAEEFASGAGRGGDADAILNGWRVNFAQVMPIAATSGAVWGLFGDIGSSVMLGDRRQFSIETSDQRYFDSDQIAIRATARIAVNAHGDGRTGNGPAAGLVQS